MIVRTPHLQDEVIFECYYAARRGETLDPPAAEHLADCEGCARRYTDAGAFLNTLSEDAEAEVSALFPPERLRAQQQEISRRLELVGRAARVISFPGRSAAAVAQKPRTPATRLTRWLAVAAAAGLFVGVAAGTAFNFGPRFDVAHDGPRTGANTAARQAINAGRPARLSSAAVAPAVDIDDMFMSDLESVLDRPHTRELIAFDQLTPHLRDVRDFAR